MRNGAESVNVRCVAVARCRAGGRTARRGTRTQNTLHHHPQAPLRRYGPLPSVADRPGKTSPSVAAPLGSSRSHEVCDRCRAPSPAQAPYPVNRDGPGPTRSGTDRPYGDRRSRRSRPPSRPAGHPGHTFGARMVINRRPIPASGRSRRDRRRMSDRSYTVQGGPASARSDAGLPPRPAPRLPPRGADLRPQADHRRGCGRHGAPRRLRVLGRPGPPRRRRDRRPRCLPRGPRRHLLLEQPGPPRALLRGAVQRARAAHPQHPAVHRAADLHREPRRGRGRLRRPLAVPAVLAARRPDGRPSARSSSSTTAPTSPSPTTSASPTTTPCSSPSSPTRAASRSRTRTRPRPCATRRAPPATPRASSTRTVRRCCTRSPCSWPTSPGSSSATSCCRSCRCSTPTPGARRTRRCSPARRWSCPART